MRSWRGASLLIRRAASKRLGTLSEELHQSRDLPVRSLHAVRQ